MTQYNINADKSLDNIEVVSVPFNNHQNPNWIMAMKNYGMTSGGVLVPVKVDEDGRQEVIQSGSNVSLNKNTIGAINLSAGQSELIVLQPEVGILKRINSIFARYDWSGATTGSLYIKFHQGGTDNLNQRILQFSSINTNNKLMITPYQLVTGDISLPTYLVGSTYSADFFEYLRELLKYDNNSPLTIKIQNDLDVAITVSDFFINEEVIG